MFHNHCSPFRFAGPDGASKLVLSFTRQAGFSTNISTFYALCRLALGVYALATVICYLFKATDAKAPKNDETNTARAEIPEETGGETSGESAEGEEDGNAAKDADDTNPADTLEPSDAPEVPKV